MRPYPPARESSSRISPSSVTRRTSASTSSCATLPANSVTRASARDRACPSNRRAPSSPWLSTIGSRFQTAASTSGSLVSVDSATATVGYLPVLAPRRLSLPARLEAPSVELDAVERPHDPCTVVSGAEPLGGKVVLGVQDGLVRHKVRAERRTFGVLVALLVEHPVEVRLELPR